MPAFSITPSIRARAPAEAAAARTDPRLLVSSSRVSTEAPSTRRAMAARDAARRFGLRPLMMTCAPALASCSLEK